MNRTLLLDLSRRAACACCAVAATLTFAVPPSLADVTVQQKTVTSGFGGFGEGTTTETLVISGDKGRSDETVTYTGRMQSMAGGPRSTTSITRLDRDLIWTLDHEQKKYTELSFAEMREMMAKGTQAGQPGMQPPAKSETGKNVEMEFSVNVQRTGKKEKVNGFAAEQVIIKLEAKPKEPKKTPGLGAFTMKLEQWVSAAVPGNEEMVAFHRKVAEKMGFDPSLQRMGGMAMAQYGDAMKELHSKLKDLEGFPVRSIMTLEAASALTPGQQAEIEQAMAEAEKAAAEAEKASDDQDKSSAASDLTKGGLSGALGGFLGRKADKAAKEKAKKGAKPGAMGGDPMMKVVTDVVSIQTGSAGASFEVPSGYTKAER